MTARARSRIDDRTPVRSPTCRFDTKKCPSALSSCLCTPAPPVSAATTAHCLAGRSPKFPADFRRRFARLLLRPLSLSTAFEARDGPSHAPGTSPAAAEIPALVLFFVWQVTSLSGINRRNDGCVPGSSEPDTVYAGSRGSDSPAISGDRMEKHPLTRQPASFAVRHRLLQDLLASPRGPFMVELFTVGSFSLRLPIAGPVRSGFDGRPSKAPHASQVERSSWEGTPEPPGRDYAHCVSLTRFKSGRPEMPGIPGLSASPPISDQRSRKSLPAGGTNRPWRIG